MTFCSFGLSPTISLALVRKRLPSRAHKFVAFAVLIINTSTFEATMRPGSRYCASRPGKIGGNGLQPKSQTECCVPGSSALLHGRGVRGEAPSYVRINRLHTYAYCMSAA